MGRIPLKCYFVQVVNLDPLTQPVIHVDLPWSFTRRTETGIWLETIPRSSSSGTQCRWVYWFKFTFETKQLWSRRSLYHVMYLKMVSKLLFRCSFRTSFTHRRGTPRLTWRILICSGTSSPFTHQPLTRYAWLYQMAQNCEKKTCIWQVGVNTGIFESPKLAL